MKISSRAAFYPYLTVTCALVFFMPFILRADSVSVSVTVSILECSDGLDNDSDTLVDYPNDPGCTSSLDNDETDPQAPSGTTTGSGGGGGGRGTRRLTPQEDTPASPIGFSGYAHPLGVVVLLHDGRFVTTALADASGFFSMPETALAPGVSLMTLYGIDKNGVKSGLVSFSLEILPRARTEVSDIFIPPTFVRATSEGIAVEGTTVPNAQVELTIQEPDMPPKTLEILSDATGAFSQRLADVSGQATVRARARISDLLASPYGETLSLFDGLSKRFLQEIDFNNDGSVNLVDFSILAHWFGSSGNLPPKIDLNKDGVVSLVDFSIMAFYWTG